MQKKFLIIILLMLFVIAGGSAYYINHYPVVVDVHGSKLVDLVDIKKHYGADISRLAWLIKEGHILNDRLKDKLISRLIVSIKSNVEQKYHVDQVYLSPILYPNDKKLYLTFDVIDRSISVSENKKLYKSIDDKDNLVKLWDEYEEKGYVYFNKYGKFPEFHECPVNHCLFGFDLPELKYYQFMFDNLVNKNKNQLVMMLNEDKNSHRRAVSAFLLAHLHNQKEVVDTLLPSINDPSGIVRNNALRVIGYILIHNKNIDIPLADLKNLLKMPLTTDRNKAMVVLLGLANNPIHHRAIIQYFGADLYAELLQKQLNVHYLSHAILKKVSGCDYGDKDYLSWQRWLVSNHVSIQG